MRMRRMRESYHYYCDSSQDEDAVLIHQSTKYGQVGRRPEKKCGDDLHRDDLQMER